MSARLAAGLVGVVFGIALSWTGMSNPEVIRAGLLFESTYLVLMFASAVAVAFLGLRLVRARGMRALLTGEPIRWATAKPQRRQFVGSALFGVGWAIADTCPGPIATQLGQGILWSLCTIAGVVIGIRLYTSRQARGAGVVAADGEQGPAQPATVPGRA